MCSISEMLVVYCKLYVVRTLCDWKIRFLIAKFKTVIHLAVKRYSDELD